MDDNAPFFTFTDYDGSTVLEITRDGEVHLGEGVSISEASIIFYNEVAYLLRSCELQPMPRITSKKPM